MFFSLCVLPIVLLLIGFPIFLVLLSAVAVTLVFFMNVPLAALHQNLFGAINATPILAVPFALTGGVLLQWAMGFNFSVAVWVGYIALFGTAIQTAIIMVVFLEEAVARANAMAAAATQAKAEAEARVKAEQAARAAARRSPGRRARANRGSWRAGRGRTWRRAHSWATVVAENT